MKVLPSSLYMPFMFASKRVGTSLETSLVKCLPAGAHLLQVTLDPTLALCQLCQFTHNLQLAQISQSRYAQSCFLGKSAWADLFTLWAFGCRLRDITGLSSRASQACFLVNLLISRQLPRLVTLLEEPWRKRLAALSLRDVVCSKDGEDTMTQLISVLLDEHQTSPGMVAKWSLQEISICS